MVADGLPPDDGQGVLHDGDSVVHGVDVHLVLQLDARVAVPALHQVHEVQHDDEGHGDVDVAVVAGVGAVEGRQGDVVVDDLLVDDGQATPGHRAQTAVDQHGEDEALPVGVMAERST